ATAPEANNFVAHLTGSDEVPSHNTRAVGQVKFQLNEDGTELEYRLISANIHNVIASHIHIAAEGVNGPIVVFLFGTVPPAGGRATWSWWLQGGRWPGSALTRSRRRSCQPATPSSFAPCRKP